jgi:hypothetical protein
MVTTSFPASRQARKSICRAYIVLTKLKPLDLAASAGRGRPRWNSSQGERTGTFLGYIRLGTAVNVQSHWLYTTALSSSQCVSTNDFDIQTLILLGFVLIFPPPQITKSTWIPAMADSGLW